MARRAAFVRGNSASEGGSNFIEPYKESMAEQIFNFLATKPSTCAEVEAHFRFLHQSASPRFNELMRSGCSRGTNTYRGERPPSEVYEIVPGANFDQHKSWIAKNTASKPKKSETEQEVLAACYAAAEVFKHSIDEDEQGQAMDRVRQVILSNL